MADTDTQYIYMGPTTGINIPQPGKKDCREVMLHSGKVVALPADNLMVKRLIALGRLKDAPAAQAAQAAPGAPAAPAAPATPATPATPAAEGSSAVASAKAEKEATNAG